MHCPRPRVLFQLALASFVDALNVPGPTAIGAGPKEQEAVRVQYNTNAGSTCAYSLPPPPECLAVNRVTILMASSCHVACLSCSQWLSCAIFGPARQAPPLGPVQAHACGRAALPALPASVPLGCPLPHTGALLAPLARGFSAPPRALSGDGLRGPRGAARGSAACARARGRTRPGRRSGCSASAPGTCRAASAALRGIRPSNCRAVERGRVLQLALRGLEHHIGHLRAREGA